MLLVEIHFRKGWLNNFTWMKNAITKFNLGIVICGLGVLYYAIHSGRLHHNYEYKVYTYVYKVSL